MVFDLTSIALFDPPWGPAHHGVLYTIMYYVVYRIGYGCRCRRMKMALNTPVRLVARLASRGFDRAAGAATGNLISVFMPMRKADDASPLSPTAVIGGGGGKFRDALQSTSVQFSGWSDQDAAKVQSLDMYTSHQLGSSPVIRVCQWQKQQPWDFISEIQPTCAANLMSFQLRRIRRHSDVLPHPLTSIRSYSVPNLTYLPKYLPFLGTHYVSLNLLSLTTQSILTMYVVPRLVEINCFHPNVYI